MSEFKNYHPIVNFIYFVFVIGFACFLMHPACLCISLICGFSYSAMLHGKRKAARSLLFMLPLMILTALINPAFNHEGVTILTRLPGGNPLTLESVLYGLCAAAMIASVIAHFSCYNEVMTSDKFIYLFARIAPAISLILSMTLRFVPHFAARLKTVTNAQKCMGRDVSKGSPIKRIRCGLTILSAMITWALENAIETADSMKARGYGLPGRTAYSVFTFDKRDALALLYLLILGGYTLVGSAFGQTGCSFFPSLQFAHVSPFSISTFLAYFLLCTYPITIEIREVRKWKILRSKI